MWFRVAGWMTCGLTRVAGDKEAAQWWVGYRGEFGGRWGRWHVDWGGTCKGWLARPVGRSLAVPVAVRRGARLSVALG